MKKKNDLIFLLIYPLLAVLVSFITKANAFFSILIFFGVPSIYLSFKAKKYIKKSLVFSLITAIPITIILDYIAHINKQWIIPNSILPYRLFGIVSIEVIFWAILNTYYVLMFYEHFLDHHMTKRLWHPHMKYGLIILISIFTTFLILLLNFPTLLKISYFYFYAGTILFLIPILLELVKYRNLIPKFLRTGAYFFFVTFLYEVTALKLGWWDFPGHQFIGWIYFVGVGFPLEELIFWIMLLAMAILAWYEFFDDDSK